MPFIPRYILASIAYGTLRNAYYLPKMYHYETDYQNGKRKINYINPLIGDYISMITTSAISSIVMFPFMLSADINRFHAYCIPELRMMHQDYFTRNIVPYFGYACRDENLFPDEFKSESNESS